MSVHVFCLVYVVMLDTAARSAPPPLPTPPAAAPAPAANRIVACSSKQASRHTVSVALRHRSAYCSVVVGSACSCHCTLHASNYSHYDVESTIVNYQWLFYRAARSEYCIYFVLLD
jgi:hypothetical protein